MYVIYALAGLVIGATQVGYSAAEFGQPTWLTVTLAVYAFIGGGVGFTATTHTPKSVETIEPSVDPGPGA